MNDAELRRHAWLDLGLHRLVAVPLVLSVLAGMVIALADDAAETLASASLIVFGVVTIGWGAMRAYASVVEEVQERTWDFQRMSALDPRALAWGKVFGAPVLAWYVGLWCLGVYAVAGTAARVPNVVATLVFAVSLAVLLHALGVATSALAARTAVAQRSRRLAGVAMLIGGVWMLPMLFALGAAGSSQDTVVHWWLLHGWPLRRFAALTALLFALWAMFAAWRAMARELREPAWWWGWPAFAAFTAFWWAGLSTPATPAPGLPEVLSLASLVLCAGAYLGLLLDPLTGVSWARLRRIATQSGAPWHRRLPLWLHHALMALAVALLALLATLLPSGSGPRLVPRNVEWMVPATVLAIALMLLRDAAVVTCFTLTSRVRRPLSLALFYIVLADALLPAFLMAMDLQGAAQAVFPFWAMEHGPALPAVGMAVHLAIALAVLAWRARGRMAAT